VATGNRGGGPGRRLSSDVGVLAGDVAAGRAGPHRYRSFELYFQLERIYDRAQFDVTVERNRARRCRQVRKRLRGAAFADGRRVDAGYDTGFIADVLRSALHRARPDDGLGKMNARNPDFRTPN